MNSKERAHLYGLCAEIAVEERPHQLTNLVIELNLLLARYAQTLDAEATLSAERVVNDSISIRMSGNST